MTPLDIPGALGVLAARRPVFHSEADFQHALAWTLQEAEPRRHIRLEYRAPVTATTYVDVLVRAPDGMRTAIELKYWTKKADFTIAGEDFALRNQGAHDISRYDFVKDIVRLERLLEEGAAEEGWVVALTNDPGYWSAASRPDTIDAAFRLSEGRKLAGRLAWGERAGSGTTHGRRADHGLAGEYELSWHDFSELDTSSAGRFRYVTVQV